MRRSIAVLLAACACASSPPPPRPAPPPPAAPRPVVSIIVIDLDSDDATDDQADALTAALRSRLRRTAGWLLEPQRPSMTTLIPALSCPRPPDESCLDRIGNQLEVDRYIWGKVTRSSTPNEVVAEIHYWARGAPEQVTLETYSSNLNDQNDDALQRVAARLVDKLDSRVRK
jgi:hypothetical protein